MRSVESFKFNLSNEEKDKEEKAHTEFCREECLELLRTPLNQVSIEGLDASDKIPKTQARNDFEVISNVIKAKAITKYMDSSLGFCLGTRFHKLEKIMGLMGIYAKDKYYELSTELPKAMMAGLLDMDTAERYTLNRCEEYFRSVLTEVGYNIPHIDCRKYNDRMWIGDNFSYKIQAGYGIFGFEDRFELEVKHYSDTVYGRSFLVDGLNTFSFIYPDMKELDLRKKNYESQARIFKEAIVNQVKNNYPNYQKQTKDLEKCLELLKKQEDKIYVINQYLDIHNAVFDYLEST